MQDFVGRLPEGTLIGDRYVLADLVGSGGQALIYRATDRKGGSDVAVKVLKENFATDPKFRERLSREANILHDLKCPASLKTYGMFWTPLGHPALVTELLLGVGLGDHLIDLEKRKRRLSVPAILACMGPIAEALDEAHRAGVIHRDLKPDNIFVLNGTDWGVPAKLLDFGFAKFQSLHSLTAEGTVAGSPRYIAPEGWLGVRELTPQFDVYSLGAVIYRCLVGQPPYPETGLAKLLQHVTRDPIPKITGYRTDLDPSMDEWVNRSLAKKPEERFSGVLEQFEALKRALS